MNRAKNKAKIDGKVFLKSAFAAEQEVLAVQLKLSSDSITHDGVMGEVNEQHFMQTLRKYLPNRYAVDNGIVIDSNGTTSDQIDIVIYDNLYTPTLLDQHAHRFIPAESVYCVLEVKPTINKKYLEYAGKKAKSVRDLLRTSIAIQLLDGKSFTKQLLPILAGIVATDVDWKDGVSSKEFTQTLNKLTDNCILNCGLALSDKAFDVYNNKLTFSPKENSLIFFIFRLLEQLHSMGNPPAVDWSKYAKVIASKS
ncbi:MAG TPA: hypothetical protein DCO68_07420 [Methylophilaceae bacterium]|nr:hypothetical protein [Methylophilaceae bacterium]HAJ71895.1 hypothetical protein [Methylophilaceae bacterium]